MYGKAFEKMYEGSLIGSGLAVFAVWNYCIARNRSGVVELNPKLLAFILGAKESEISGAIERLCSPDPASRSKVEGGRRLIKEGEYQYHMVNWASYDSMRSGEDQREYNRRKQAEWRARQRKEKREIQDVSVEGVAGSSNGVRSRTESDGDVGEARV